MSERPVTEPSDRPGVASAEEGQVVLDGPDGIAITLTIEAARQTGESLIAAANAAAPQRSDFVGDGPGA